MWICVAPQVTAGADVCDPDTWKYYSAPDTNTWVSVTVGLDLFVAIANEGGTGQDTAHLIMTSPDGQTWTEQATTTSGGLNADEWQCICFSIGSERFCAVAEDGTDGRVITSDDATTWTYQASPGNGWNAVVSNDSTTFVAVSTFNSGRDTMRSTNNGVTWSGSDSGIDHGTRWNGMAYNGTDTMIAVGQTGGGSTTLVRYSTDDGSSWTGATSGVPANEWMAACWSPTFSKFYACAQTGSANRVMSSPDGITWTALDTTGMDQSWKGITEGDGTIVVVGDDDTLLVSFDGSTFEVRNAPGSQNWNSVAFLTGVGFAAVSTNHDVVAAPFDVSRVMMAPC